MGPYHPAVRDFIACPEGGASISLTCATAVLSRTCRVFTFQPIPALRFYCVVAVLFLADIVIITVWVVLDPLQRQEMRFHLQVYKAETLTIEESPLGRARWYGRRRYATAHSRTVPKRASGDLDW